MAGCQPGTTAQRPFLGNNIGNSVFSPAGQSNQPNSFPSLFANWNNNANRQQTTPWWQAFDTSLRDSFQNANSNPWWQARSNQDWQSGGLANQGPFNTNPYAQLNNTDDLQRQIQDLNQRLGRFNNLNSGMEGEIAALQQRLQTANDLNFQLRQQLADSAVQIQQLQIANQQSNQQLLAMQNQLNQSNMGRGSSGITVPSQTVTAPVIRANNSLMDKLSTLQIGGVHARMDGDVIRIELPSEALFVPGTFQVQSSNQNMLNQLVQVIRQHFPRQSIGIEAHWDKTPIQGYSHQHLTATQALSVYQVFQQLGLPEQQMFTMGMGSNRPKYQSASVQDRRIEIVIYPETYQ